MAVSAVSTVTGNIVVLDKSHAIDKDSRTLFESDNRKNHRKNSHVQDDIPELHLLSYYGDTTGPNELNLRNHCVKKIESHIKTWRPNKKNALDSEANKVVVCQAMFEESAIDIMHISHYSFEFVVNVSETSFLNDYKLDDNAANHYLVGTYQQHKFDTYIDEFVTIGLTSSVPHAHNTALYEFYVDDFVQDLYKILYHTEWYHESEFPPELWYIIAEYTMDCIRPVAYTRADGDEIILNDGQLHLFLTGELSPFHGNKDDDDSGDMKSDIDDKLQIIGQIFVDLGRIVHKQYRGKVKKLKSEYDSWKKPYKKRIKSKPSNKTELTAKLHQHQKKRKAANDIESVNKLEYLYYKNPNFKLKFNDKPHAKSSTIQSFKKLFSFGSSSKSKKNKHKISESYMPSYSQKTPVIMHKSSESARISRSHTVPIIESKNRKKKKSNQRKISHPKKKNQNKTKNGYQDYEHQDHRIPLIGYNDKYNFDDIEYESKSNGKSYPKQNKYTKHKYDLKETSSLPHFDANGSNSSGRSTSSMSRSKSTGNYMGKRQRNNKYTHPHTNGSNQFVTMSMMNNPPNSGDTHINDNDLPDAVLEETESADSAISKPKGGRLQPTLNKPRKGSHNTAYSHEQNEIYYLDYQTSNNLQLIIEDKVQSATTKQTNHARQGSMTIKKVKDDIRRAYRDYEREKGFKPWDIQKFVSYCKKRKIKKANWSLCQFVMKEMENEIK